MVGREHHTLECQWAMCGVMDFHQLYSDMSNHGSCCQRADSKNHLLGAIVIVALLGAPEMGQTDSCRVRGYRAIPDSYLKRV